MTTDIPESGVVMNPPPPQFIDAVNRSISEFVSATLRPGDRGGIVAVGTTTGFNLAVVQRVGKGGEIVAFIGKDWGAPIEAQIMWRQRW